MNIGQRIDRSYGELTPQEQRVADFILDHLSDLAVYNASELARLSGVAARRAASTSAVASV